MAKHPIYGASGSKPRVAPAAPPMANGEPASKAEIQRLSAEYLTVRNAQMRARAEREQIALEEKRGTLISKQLAGFQAAYLLTCFRRRVMAEPAALAQRLVAAGFMGEELQHGAQELIKGALYAMLSELADLPAQVTDPAWIEQIDDDLAAQVDGGSEPQTPAEIKREGERVKRRRTKQTQAARERRSKA